MKNQTKKLIMDAFNELLEKKPFEKITVEEVCAHAGISKPTFYRYYRDKYDVMTYNFQLLFDEYFAILEYSSLEEFLVAMYRSTQENFVQIRRAFDILGRNSMNDVIYSYAVGAMVELLAKAQGGEITNRQRIQCDILAYGISYIGDNWINGRYELTPEEAAAATLELMTDELIALGNKS